MSSYFERLEYNVNFTWATLICACDNSILISNI